MDVSEYVGLRIQELKLLISTSQVRISELENLKSKFVVEEAKENPEEETPDPLNKG